MELGSEPKKANVTYKELAVYMTKLYVFDAPATPKLRSMKLSPLLQQRRLVVHVGSKFVPAYPGKCAGSGGNTTKNTELKTTPPASSAHMNTTQKEAATVYENLIGHIDVAGNFILTLSPEYYEPLKNSLLQYKSTLKKYNELVEKLETAGAKCIGTAKL